MILKQINLVNFRNYEKLKLKFNKGINILYGSNAQGKTNLLESIYFLGLTKSHRPIIDNNLIMNGKTTSNIEGIINNGKLDKKLNINFDSNNKKLFIDNNQIKKVSDYISNLNIIIFCPDDLELIKLSPQVRRKYLNMELSQLYSNYYIVLNEYTKLLKIRNNYLKKYNKHEPVDDNYFDILTNYLVDKAILIYKMRYKFINKINDYCENIYKNIMNIDNFKIIYKPNINDLNIFDENIKNNLLNIFNKNKDMDIKLCCTLIGPHKDDFEFYLNDKNLKLYGSQGQQRAAVLTLKLSEIELFKKYKENTPILLLDDIFSELDDNKKNNLLKYIVKDIQTIITTTDLNNLDNKLIKKSKIYKIEQGKVEKIKEVKINE
ncbi:MAG: DNA replication/repair protein RecF [Bacilli bacterium]|nr:DNA replication/repair protein RecF [Bacilli bacterium]